MDNNKNNKNPTTQTEKLCKERDQLKQYLDVAEILLMTLDTNGNVTSINQKGCKLLGRNENEIIGCNWFDTYIYDKDTEAIKYIFNRVMFMSASTTAVAVLGSEP